MGALAGERCDICGGVLGACVTDFELSRRGQRVVVEDIHADVCMQCGEKYISAETMRQIEQTVAQATRMPVRYLNVPVYKLEPSV